jgi:uncharacterized protein (DUF58 family)
MILFLLIFLFAPFRVVRVVSALFFLVEALSLIASRMLPRAFLVTRRDEVIRVNRLQRIRVTLDIRNRWPLPIRSVLITDGPSGVFPLAPAVFLRSFQPRERATFVWEAEARDRGDFQIGPVAISGPGPFGMHAWEIVHRAPVRLLVYPAVYPLSLEHRKGLPAGNLAVLNRLYEDVSRFRSLREYAPGDELRRINWKVSARLGKLHTTEYNPSLYFPVLVLLNLCAPDYPLEARYSLIERAIELAGSLVVYFAGLKQEVGLAAAARIPGERGPVTVPIKAGTSHGVRILEALARAHAADEEMDFAALVLGGSVSGGVALPTGTRVLAVTPRLSRERRASLQAIARRGLQLEVFLMAGPAAWSALAGVVTHSVGQGEEIDLHE